MEWQKTGDRPVEEQAAGRTQGEPEPVLETGTRAWHGQPLTARIERFDTFWEAPKEVEKGYERFARFYEANYLPHLSGKKDDPVLVISCGPGYFVHFLRHMRYSDVLGIDSDPAKVKLAVQRGLNCRVEEAFPFLQNDRLFYDLIFVEQEINHLTKEEILVFLQLCKHRLRPGGRLIVHSLNGANPITGAEALAQNFDHYNTFTDYSLRQLLSYSGFQDIRVFPLKLYVFYRNPLNYVGMAATGLLELFFRLSFLLYGKANRIFSKKIGAVAVKP